MQIEIWSDLICPWCYIGKRRFEAAISRVGTIPDFEITWRSFELDPSAPTHLTETLEQMLARKYNVSVQQAREMNANVTQIAAQVGLTYQLSKARPGNTFAAHRLIHHAATLGVGDKLTECLMRGYFCESLAVGEHEALAQAATNAGLDFDESLAVLTTDRYAKEVRADEQRAAKLGIRGVPFFLFNGKEGVSGAQPVSVFEEAIKRNT